MKKISIEKGKKAHSVKAAAAHFDASVQFVRKQIKLGHLRAKRCGRKIIILDTDLQSFLENQKDVNWKE
jgi:hypothetical protein